MFVGVSLSDRGWNAADTVQLDVCPAVKARTLALYCSSGFLNTCVRLHVCPAFSAEQAATAVHDFLLQRERKQRHTDDGVRQTATHSR